MHERFRSGSTRQPRGYEESRQGVVKYQYFSTPGNEQYFRRFALFRSRLDGSSEQLSLLEPGRSKSNEFSLCATSLLSEVIPRVDKHCLCSLGFTEAKMEEQGESMMEVEGNGIAVGKTSMVK